MNALRPDWLARLLGVLLSDPHASIEQIARRLGLRPSEVRLELEVFYLTRLDQIPVQWWAPLARLLAQDVVPPLVSPPAQEPPPPPPSRTRSCVDCGAALPWEMARPWRCDACASARAAVIGRERVTPPTKPAKPRKRRLSIDEIFARELAKARRSMHVDGWAQGHGVAVADRGPDTRGLA